jgi:hypothetical protein
MTKPSEDLVIWQQDGDVILLAARCGECDGMGRFATPSEEYLDCEACLGLGWFGIDPEQPVMAHAGSAAKVAMLTARYATGVPLWHVRDGRDDDLRLRNLAETEQFARPTAAKESMSRREESKRQRRLARLAP